MKNSSRNTKQLAFMFMIGQMIFIAVSLMIIVGSEAASFETKAILGVLSFLMVPAFIKTAKNL